MSRILLLLALLLAVPSPLARAHHILGIPHYAYSDEYPQTPFVEVMAQVGSKDLDFTYYPGIPDPGDRLRFKLYVRDRETGEPYTEPLTVVYARKSFFGGSEAIHGPVEIRPGVGPEANDFKFFFTFEDAEAYEVRVAVPNGDDVEVVPFPVTIGQTDSRPLLLAAAGTVGIAVVAVALIKRRRAARPATQLRRGEAHP